MRKEDLTAFEMERTEGYNNGQHWEQFFRYVKTGKIVKADNVPHDKGTDLFDYSIKSARATVCKGTDLKAYLDNDTAKEFVYITKTKIAYIMSRKEYEIFVSVFQTLDRDSEKHEPIIRLKHESQQMLRWLERYSH